MKADVVSEYNLAVMATLSDQRGGRCHARHPWGTGSGAGQHRYANEG
jgi:hypothetical protein